MIPDDPRRAGPGKILDGRFRLVDEIGRGGMSTIFRAEDLQDGGRLVVVKVPLPMFASGLGAWSLFQQEEEIGRQMDHPFVLGFLALPPDRRRSYLVTEYVAGVSLATLLHQRGPLPEKEALTIVRKLCEAVAYVHERGFVHYDVKPDNVILCPDGTIRLIDFGLAHRATTSRFVLSRNAPAIGSSNYVAPEQVKRLSGRTSVDIYALGAVLYEMLTGRAPFPNDDPFVVASARLLGDPPAPTTLNPAISPAAEEIVLRALRRNPVERHPTARALLADLDRPDRVVVSGLARRLRPVTGARRFWRRARYVTLVALLPLASQVALFGLLWRHFAHKK